MSPKPSQDFNLHKLAQGIYPMNHQCCELKSRISRSDARMNMNTENMSERNCKTNMKSELILNIYLTRTSAGVLFDLI